MSVRYSEYTNYIRSHFFRIGRDVQLRSGLMVLDSSPHLYEELRQLKTILFIGVVPGIESTLMEQLSIRFQLHKSRLSSSSTFESFKSHLITMNFDDWCNLYAYHHDRTTLDHYASCYSYIRGFDIEGDFSDREVMFGLQMGQSVLSSLISAPHEVIEFETFYINVTGESSFLSQAHEAEEDDILESTDEAGKLHDPPSFGKYDVLVSGHQPINIIYAPPHSGKTQLVRDLKLPETILFDTSTYRIMDRRKVALWTITDCPYLLQRATGMKIAIIPSKKKYHERCRLRGSSVQYPYDEILRLMSTADLMYLTDSDVSKIARLPAGNASANSSDM